MSTPILEVSELSKYFRSHWTFSKTPGISDGTFSVPEGEAFGFLGHNGAGKTTTVKCIIGLIHYQAGTIKYRGQIIRKNAKQSINFHSELGYLPEPTVFLRLPYNRRDTRIFRKSAQNPLYKTPTTQQRAHRKT